MESDSRGLGRTVSSARTTPWALAVALAVATLLLYAPVLRFEFIRYDDPHYLLLNPRIAQGLSWDNVRWALTAYQVANWHPLTLISHMTDVSLFGMRAGAHHAVNALLHAVNAALLFLVLNAATRRRAPSLIAATLFAVHPLNVESVAWVSQRKTVLCMLFVLLTLLAYVAWARRGGAARYGIALCAFAAALAAKPMAVVLPALLLLIDVWPLSRWPADDPRRLRSAMRLVLEKVPFAALAVAASLLTWAAQKAGGALASVGDPSPGSRFASATFAYGWYVFRMVWPSDLSLFYPMTLGPAAALKVAGAAILLAALTAIAVTLFRAMPYLAFGWAWYAVALAPVCGLVKFGTQIVADRYAYLALVGPFVALAFAGDDLLAGRSTGIRRTAAAAGTAAMLALTFANGFALASWRDSVTILARGLKRAPDNVHAIANMGLELVKRERYAEAIVLLTRAAELRPGYVTVHEYLGHAYDRTGRPADARTEYEAALALQPGDAKLCTELGGVLAELGMMDGAEAKFREAVQEDSGYAEAWRGLGTLLRAAGRFAEAEPALRRAEELERNQAAPDRR